VVLGLRQDADTDAIFDIFDDVVERGTATQRRTPHKGRLRRDLGALLGDGRGPVNGVVMGAYYLKPNFPGRAAHIANAGYVVARSARGMGIGELLVEDSIRRAPKSASMPSSSIGLRKQSGAGPLERTAGRSSAGSPMRSTTKSVDLLAKV